MDPRLSALLAQQQAARFAGLAGSEARATIRISAELVNQAVEAFAAQVQAIRDLSVRPRASNRFDVHVKLARAGFLPSLNLTMDIEHQPELPANPELVLRIGGAGGMMRLAGPAISSFGVLPPGLRLDGDRLFVDVRAVLIAHGQGELLEFVEQMQVLTEEGALVLLVQAAVR